MYSYSVISLIFLIQDYIKKIKKVQVLFSVKNENTVIQEQVVRLVKDYQSW